MYCATSVDSSYNIYTRNSVTKTNLNGGAIFANSGNVTSNGDIFMSNSAYRHGGGITAGSASSVVMVTGGIFTGNTAQNGYGGSVYTLGDVITFDSQFSTSTAIYGGAVYSQKTNTFMSSTCTNSHTSADGSCVWGQNGVTLTSSNFTSNNVKGAGTVYTRYGDMIVNNCNFIDNECSGGYSAGGKSTS